MLIDPPWTERRSALSAASARSLARGNLWVHTAAEVAALLIAAGQWPSHRSRPLVMITKSSMALLRMKEACSGFVRAVAEDPMPTYARVVNIVQ
jgi:hypothetical protein